ncbi:protein NEDD1 isoform X2 [Dunckerocampus dactyliophorus]|uniref:protein NEDD1 isoform X2 n=1 Tax=Dunckerocampus dactyliophorus TaxID=161453 RepID=UPI0024072FD6|nr:protein NEDD1 isoform X2 [Dunckerocampus dactyliophorus]
MKFVPPACPYWRQLHSAYLTTNCQLVVALLELFEVCVQVVVMDDITRLVSTGDSIKIWDAASMAPLEHFNPHRSSHPVSQACWSSNNQYLVSASSSGDKVVLSSLKSSPVPLVELAEGKRQTRVCLSTSSQFVVSGGLDHCVHIWDLKTKRLQRSLKEHKEEVTCVSFNANDSCIASGSTSGDLVLHSLTTNMSSKAFGHGSQQPIHDLRLSTLKRSLLGSVSDSGTLVLWDANTQKELHVFDSAHKAPGSGIAFSPISELLVVSVGLDKKIIFYDTNSKSELQSIRVESPLTSVDFTPDGSGLVVGSTHGKIFQYDLRNSSAPNRITMAHKTSVTCLRFQSNSSRHKSSKMTSSRVSSTKRSSSKVTSSHIASAPTTNSSPQMQTSAEGAGAKVANHEDGQKGAEHPPLKFSGIGRNSLDLFSPAREDAGTQLASAEETFGPAHVTMASREGEGPQVSGRVSLDIFSPVREESGLGSLRKTPLLASADRCYSPLSISQTPTIKEEEPAEACDLRKTSSSSLEGDDQTPPTSTQQTNLSQPAPPFFTPEPSLRRANCVQAQLDYDSPFQRAPPTLAAGASAAASLTANIAQVAVQGGAAPLTSLQIHFIQNMIHETLEDFRDTCHRDIVNLQVEMIRQFYIQLNEIHSLIERYSLNESLVEEIERLKEENRRLKTNF